MEMCTPAGRGNGGRACMWCLLLGLGLVVVLGILEGRGPKDGGRGGQKCVAFYAVKTNVILHERGLLS